VRISTFVRGLVFVLVLAGTEARLECVRWWSSPTVVSALGLTAEQTVAIERLYQDSLPARRHASEELCGLTGQIASRIEAGEYDDESLHLTERLAKAQSAQRDARRQMLELAARALSPEQRETLSRLVGEKRVMR
jgi:Spy/CpxP family protein refolding chaperone